MQDQLCLLLYFKMIIDVLYDLKDSSELLHCCSLVSPKQTAENYLLYILLGFKFSGEMCVSSPISFGHYIFKIWLENI